MSVYCPDCEGDVEPGPACPGTLGCPQSDYPDTPEYAAELAETSAAMMRLQLQSSWGDDLQKSGSP